MQKQKIGTYAAPKVVPCLTWQLLFPKSILVQLGQGNHRYTNFHLLFFFWVNFSYVNGANICRKLGKSYDKVPCEISSKKLKDLGFSYKHSLEEIIHQTIMCCLDYGYLPSV